MALVGGVAGAFGADPPEAPPPPGFATRILKVEGDLGSTAGQAHVGFGLELGFNALWLTFQQVGTWGSRGSPRLNDNFVELARHGTASGLRLFVEVAPERMGEAFIYYERDGARRLHKLARMLRREAGVVDLVLRFSPADRTLTELGDILRYGRSAAPAHIDLAARLADKLPDPARLWLAPSALPGASTPADGYVSSFIDAVGSLPSAVGIVWPGPNRPARNVGADDLPSLEEELGARAFLLEDGFPANGDTDGLTYALILGPLRHRDPALAVQVEGYVASPMPRLGGSRLSLITVADYLHNPRGYHPDDSWEAAILRLAGDDERAHEALRVQADEWGGWIGELNYRTAATDHPDGAARILRDPAASNLFTWTGRRYPERMAALAGLTDRTFRNDLIEVMEFRLAVARAVPLLRRLRELDETDPRVTAIVEQLSALRAALADRPTVRQVLDRFVGASGIPERIVDELIE